MITDNDMRQLYKQCIDQLPSDDLTSDKLEGGQLSQFFRGITGKLWKNQLHPDHACSVKMKVFNTFNIIPEDCFSCYKIVIIPRTVVELFKLMVVFEQIELPEDNTRKCMIELRPEISGAYKGYIYFQSLDDAKEILDPVKAIVSENISADIEVSIKRGCSEYPIAYPDYSRFDEFGNVAMTYKEEWRPREEYVYKHLVGHIDTRKLTHNPSPPGFSLQDIWVMHRWLAYAAAIGDSSYREITDMPLPRWPRVERSRPRFQPMEKS